tara:strand:- start:57773 stop:58594 length:822 start_codon:yes stop_codon:yes gene_type:complete
MSNTLKYMFENLACTFSPKKGAEHFDASYEVNYVWINDQKQEPNEGGAACSMPLKLLDRVFNNANKYPDAQYNIWVDRDLMDPLSHFFIVSHAYLASANNVKFRSLRDVAKINEYDDIFGEKKPKHIWARVDLARILVLEHQLKENPDPLRLQLYSDFDVKDLKLRCKHMKNTLNRHGMFFGRTLGVSAMLENGYMCFGQNGRDFLEGKLLPKTMEAVHADNNGWKALVKTHESLIKDYNFFYRTRMVSGPRQESTKYEVPDNPFYISCGLNK